MSLFSACGPGLTGLHLGNGNGVPKRGLPMKMQATMRLKCVCMCLPVVLALQGYGQGTNATSAEKTPSVVTTNNPTHSGNDDHLGFDAAAETATTNNHALLSDEEVGFSASTKPKTATTNNQTDVKPWTPPEVETELNETEVRAEHGDAKAQFDLGCAYFWGDGLAKDDVEAVKWWRKAAEQGHAEAQYDLGYCYAAGYGVTNDTHEAIKWYRKAAEQGERQAQCQLGLYYEGLKIQGEEVKSAEVLKPPNQRQWHAEEGDEAANDEIEAAKWFRKAAEQGEPTAQSWLGELYCMGSGVPKDTAEGIKWYRKSAEQGNANAQCDLGGCYCRGEGVPQDYTEAVKWYRRAAEQGDAFGQELLGGMYELGQGVPEDYVQAYKWFNLAAAQGDTNAISDRDIFAKAMTPDKIAEAQELSRGFKPHTESSSVNSTSPDKPTATGTGFFITDDGFLVTCAHVVEGAREVHLLTSAGLIDAKVISVDTANDIALLKASNKQFSLSAEEFLDASNGVAARQVEVKFAPLPVASSRTVSMGSTVATVGFPNIGLQGFAPKLAKGEIAALSGAEDDPHYFQISVPVQPGNSGGALVNEHGNVVGIVSAKLDATAALEETGALPENVNYAVKSGFLLTFLESVPDVAAKLKAPNTADRKFEDVVKTAQSAAVLVLVY